MLELYSDNERFDLPDDIEVDLTFENPFLSQDRIPLTYSMPFGLPATATNMRKFKQPKRITSIGSWTAFKSLFKFNGIIFSQGNIILTEVEKILTTSYVGVLAIDLFKKMLNGLSSITDFLYNFGEGSIYEVDLDSGWGQNYKDTILAKSREIGTKFAACPVRVESEEWIGNTDINGVYNVGKLYFNMYNVNDGSYVFSTALDDIHSTVFPQPYIHYLINQVLGESLNENFFANDDELKTLCMITSFHKYFQYNFTITTMRKGILVDYDDEFPGYFHMYLNSFFNKYAFNVFLKDILKLFCCSLIPRSDGKLDIIHNKVILDSTEVEDWSDKLVGTPVITLEKGKRYNYGYQSESFNSGNEVYSTLDSIDDLLLSGWHEGKYQISTTGEVIEKILKEKVNPEDPDEYTYEVISSNFGSNIIETDEEVEAYDINSSTKPIPMNVDDFWWENTGITREKWYVPEFHGDRTKNDFAPNIGFMRGYYGTLSHDTNPSPSSYFNRYPFLTPYNYDMAGNKIGDYSLAWEGEDGLIAKFHTEFKAYVEKDKHVLKGYFKLSELDLKNINYKIKTFVRGMKYYKRKIEVILKTKTLSLARVELIEA